jgi:hypothetical protein
MAGCADVSLLMKAAMMESPSPTAASPEEGKPSKAEKESEKLADARKLVEMTRAQSIFVQTSSGAVHQMVAAVRQRQPDISERYLVVIEKEVSSIVQEGMTTEGGLLDMLAPLYAKYFTHKEIKKMLAYYQTDVGEKVISVSQELTRGFSQVQQHWFKALQPIIQQAVIERLKAEGVELNN